MRARISSWQIERMTNHQITITKETPTSNITKQFGVSVIGYWSLFGVCYLVIGD